MKAGDRVKAGDLLMVMTAMKMEVCKVTSLAAEEHLGTAGLSRLRYLMG